MKTGCLLVVGVIASTLPPTNGRSVPDQNNQTQLQLKVTHPKSFHVQHIAKIPKFLVLNSI